MQHLAIRYDSSFVRFSRMEILRLVNLNFRFPSFGNYRNHTIFTRGDGRLRRRFPKAKTRVGHSDKLQLQSRRSHLQIIDSTIVNSIHPSCSLLLNPLPFWPTALPSVAGMYRIIRKAPKYRSRSRKSKEKRRMPTRQYNSGEGEPASEWLKTIDWCALIDFAWRSISHSQCINSVDEWIHAWLFCRNPST